ncbi:uncharacterized protein N7473_011266 [Penicillium subrubescens]|uniref:Uncharacterized protein n=1 Tax=Penicillium subrubescens TaxID=1316194 RepID=A0A1Q5U5I0_9EURO|nr:uncharacterized protein N7473_011266 [Penicillium subrubescens]KAJ5880213.1 hypothetical protein N7473_011266 [Penicillium subrubescens]OKP07708.1 hypothetical protein PENSUB_5823 [Penicillium subrubescens]
MDPFSIFPPEVILSILEFCTDFASLDGLLRTSARADQVFGKYYKTITERVMKNCLILSHGLQYEFRMIILLELEKTSFTLSSLPVVLDSINTPSDVPLSVPADHSLRAVRKAVSIAGNICYAASACLHVMMDRLMAAEPRRVVGSPSAVEWIEGSLSEVQSEPIRIRYHPPSWAETYRTHRILWALAIFSCVLHAANTRWDWSLEDKDSFIERYTRVGLTWRPEQLKTIAECLCILNPSEAIALDHRFPFMVTIPSFLHSPARLIIPNPPERNQAVDKDWEKIYRLAGRQNGAIGTYRQLLRVHWPPRPPLQSGDLRVFRRLGIPIWDDWRLHLIGLIDRPSDSNCLDSSVFDYLPKELASWSTACALFTWWDLAKKGDLDEKIVAAHS